MPNSILPYGVIITTVMNDCFLKDEGGGAELNEAPQLIVPPAPTQFHAHGPGPEAGVNNETIAPEGQRPGSVDDRVGKDCPLSGPQVVGRNFQEGSSQRPFAAQ